VRLVLAASSRLPSCLMLPPLPVQTYLFLTPGRRSRRLSEPRRSSRARSRSPHRPPLPSTRSRSVATPLRSGTPRRRARSARSSKPCFQTMAHTSSSSASSVCAMPAASTAPQADDAVRSRQHEDAQAQLGLPDHVHLSAGRLSEAAYGRRRARSEARRRLGASRCLGASRQVMRLAL